MFRDNCAEYSTVIGHATKVNENVRRVKRPIYTIKSELNLIKMLGSLKVEERRTKRIGYLEFLNRRIIFWSFMKHHIWASL